ncbi:hypothetical protein LOKG_00047 [Loktanella phage pCB2051-A]|uniref:Uncharacterized protein n=1 Tax=Loktanella phage pCB2051-A TaxID=754044 RepID=M4QRK3_9CAUD|nr:hypothetical protein LOKG_00047 [Loktanella phage pCB2051-A]AGH31483.1 hypothetical protein LOKG_00047 [Loktanella phage pCB2051-A]
MTFAEQETARMDYQYWPAIITAISGILITFGAGAKWMISRQDQKAQLERERQDSERQKLELMMLQRISSLETTIGAQKEEIDRMRGQIASYSRHVGVLEGILVAKGIEVPRVPGALINEQL